MNKDLINDIQVMLDHYKFTSKELTTERLNFRFDLLQEEFDELQKARISNDAPEIVDALIDIIVIAIGTLELANVDTSKAWSEVLCANMAKQRGIKPGRPSDGWDLCKPDGWQEPDHSNNTGNLIKLMEKTNESI